MYGSPRWSAEGEETAVPVVPVPAALGKGWAAAWVDRVAAPAAQDRAAVPDEVPGPAAAPAAQGRAAVPDAAAPGPAVATG